MDSDSEESSSYESRDSGFFEDLIVIDELARPLSDPGIYSMGRGLATDSLPNAPKPYASAPANANLAQSRNDVLKELLEQVPEVETAWFVDNVLPALRPEVSVTSVVDRMAQDGLINRDGYWSLWPQYPISATPETTENVIYRPFQDLAAKICERSGIPDASPPTATFICIPDKPPQHRIRPNTSKPDCAAVLRSSDPLPPPQPGSSLPSSSPSPSQGACSLSKPNEGTSLSSPADGVAPSSSEPGDTPISKLGGVPVPTSNSEGSPSTSTAPPETLEGVAPKVKKTNTLKWMDIACPGEFNINSSNPKFAHDNRVKVLWSLAYIMREDPRRRFVFGFTIENVNMRLWFCSRSDVIVSKPFDFMKDHATVAHFILSIAYADRSSLGWDETITIAPNANGRQLPVNFDIRVRGRDGTVTTYRTRRMLSDIGADAVRGRGTRVWEAYKLDKDGNIVMKINKRTNKPTKEPQLFVLKDCWIDADREREGIILTRVFDTTEEDQADGLDQLVHQYFLDVDTHGDVYVGDEPDHTRKVMFRGQQLPRMYDTLHVPQEYNERVGIVSNTAARGSMALQRADLEETPLYSGKAHYRIVYTAVGKTLRTVESMSEIFKYMACVADAVSVLYDRGWIHRDISVGNILIVGSGKNKQLKLSDLEYAKRLEDNNPSHGIRTGTIFFMSTEVENHGYLYWQDPEVEEVPELDRKMARQQRQQRQLQQPEQEQQEAESRPRTPPSTQVDYALRHAPFRHNGLHDAESVFWLGLYLLLTSVMMLTDSKVDKEQKEQHVQYQRAQRRLASKVFCDPSFRYKAMVSDGKLVEDIASLHPRVQYVLKALDNIRKQIVSTFKQAERHLDREPYMPDLRQLRGLLFNMTNHFERISKALAKDDIKVHTHRSLAAKARAKLQAEVKQVAGKRKPDEQPRGGEDGPAKKVRTGDGAAASLSSAPLLDPSASDAPVSGTSVASVELDPIFFGSAAPNPGASSSIPPSSTPSGSSSSRVSTTNTTSSRTSSSRMPIPDVEATPTRSNKGKARELRQ